MLKLVVALSITAFAQVAHAVSACDNNFGFAPRAATILPPRARVLSFDEGRSGDLKFEAKIDGKKVPLKVTTTTSTPYTMRMIEVDSDKTGTLVISQVAGKERFEVARYKVRADVKMPADVKTSARRFTREIRHSTVEETYDAVAIDVGDSTPAILATIKTRRDAQSSWSTLSVPVSPGDWIDKSTAIRIGKLGCAQNFTVDLFKAGLEVEASVTLVDGSTRALKLPNPVKL